MFFFSPGSLVYDLTGDGQKDLVVIKNKEASDYLLGQIRTFKGGSIEVLALNELGLSPNVAPKKFPGQITDIFINDCDNDGKPELLVSVIKKPSEFLSRGSESVLVAYKLR